MRCIPVYTHTHTHTLGFIRNFRLPPWRKWVLSLLLRNAARIGIYWRFGTNYRSLGRVKNLEDETDSWGRNVFNCRSSLRNIPEELNSHLVSYSEQKRYEILTRRLRWRDYLDCEGWGGGGSSAKPTFENGCSWTQWTTKNNQKHEICFY